MIHADARVGRWYSLPGLYQCFTFQGRGHWIEVYGDRGTLVVVTIRRLRSWFSALADQRETQRLSQAISLSSNYPDGRIAPFIRVIDSWVQGIARGEALTPSQEGVYHSC